jgi:uncharacterized damage-inducible protein DinB
MSLTKLISNYASFNEWANTQIINWLKQVDKPLLYQTSISSFKSIDYTLQHILRTQKYWLTFIAEQDTSHLNWAVREGEVEIICFELLDISKQMKTVFSSYSEKELIHTLNLDSPWAKNSLSRYEYIIHVVNHSTFHRGQIITQARAVGITEGIVNTDYNIFNCR